MLIITPLVLFAIEVNKFLIFYIYIVVLTTYDNVFNHSKIVTVITLAISCSQNFYICTNWVYFNKTSYKIFFSETTKQI